MNFRPSKWKIIIILLFAIILVILMTLIGGMILVALSDAPSPEIMDYLFSFIIALPIAIIAGVIIWVPSTLFIYLLFSLFQKSPDIKEKTGNWGFTKLKTLIIILGFLIPFASVYYLYSLFHVPNYISFLSFTNALIPGFITAGLIYLVWSLSQRKEIKTKKIWFIIFVVLMILIISTMIFLSKKSHSSLCLIENPQSCDYSCKTDEDCRDTLGLFVNKNEIVAMSDAKKGFNFSKFECGCIDNKCQRKNCRGQHYGCVINESISCCEGLKELKSVGYVRGECKFSDCTFCSPCGNGICDGISENICNCPEDCP